MPNPPKPDPLPLPSPEAIVSDVAALLPLLALPGQPGPAIDAVEACLARRVGHQLFTLLYVDGDEVARIHSNRPQQYPVSGRKRMGPTPWGDHVLKAQRAFFGADVDAIRWAFPDHALIERMGLGAVINVPCRYDGLVIGTINLLTAEHGYREAQVAVVEAFAPVLVPAFLAARAAAGIGH